MLKGYLAGPIENITVTQAVGWRDMVADSLTGLVHFHNPMSGKERIVRGEKIISPKNYNKKLRNLVKADAIFGRDLVMIEDSDFLFVNFLEHKAASIGTMFEIGYACAKDKLIVLVNDSDSMLKHPFILRSCVCFTKLDDALEFVTSLALDFKKEVST